MKMGWVVVCLVFALSTQQSALAESVTQIAKKRAPQSPSISSGSSVESDDRKSTAFALDGIVGQLLKFRAAKPKVLSLASVADLLWDLDETQSRRLFATAIEMAATAAKADNGGRSSKEELSETERHSLLGRVLSRVAKRDAEWARRFVERDVSIATQDRGAISASSQSAESSNRAILHLTNAASIVKADPTKAAQLAEVSFNLGLPNKGFAALFLNALRLKDEPTANRLFLKTLERLIAEPMTDPNEVLSLGTYVLTSPATDFGDIANLPMIHNVIINKVLVVNVSKARPGIPPPIIAAYLDAAVTVLTRSAPDPAKQQLYYAAEYQLLPQVQIHNPVRAQELVSAMASLIPDIPSAMTLEGTYADLHRRSRVENVEQTLREIENVVDERKRDGRYLGLASSLYDRGKLSDARVVGERIKDLRTRAELIALIDYREAIRSLDSGDTILAESSCAKVAPAAERSILLMAIARVHIEAKNLTRAAEGLVQALKEARRVEDQKRALLLLGVASLLARADPILATSVLAEAVHAFNAFEYETWTHVVLFREVTAGGKSLLFSLNAKGLPVGLTKALPPLIEADYDAGYSILSGLNNEDLKGQALVALAAARLNQTGAVKSKR